MRAEHHLVCLQLGIWDQSEIDLIHMWDTLYTEAPTCKVHGFVQ